MVVGLISFLTGLIMAFQAAPPLRQFGVDIFVVNLVALAMLRELGPIMTAIVLAGRSGSAFAAEIGTMKINEEINALTTMGLDPVRFLVAPRVLAGILVTPVSDDLFRPLGCGGWTFCHVGKGISFRDCLAPIDWGRRHQRCDGRHYQGVRFWRTWWQELVVFADFRPNPERAPWAFPQLDLW